MLLSLHLLSPQHPPHTPRPAQSAYTSEKQLLWTTGLYGMTRKKEKLYQASNHISWRQEVGDEQRATAVQGSVWARVVQLHKWRGVMVARRRGKSHIGARKLKLGPSQHEGTVQDAGRGVLLPKALASLCLMVGWALSCRMPVCMSIVQIAANHYIDRTPVTSCISRNQIISNNQICGLN